MNPNAARRPFGDGAASVVGAWAVMPKRASRLRPRSLGRRDPQGDEVRQLVAPPGRSIIGEDDDYGLASVQYVHAATGAWGGIGRGRLGCHAEACLAASTAITG